MMLLVCISEPVDENPIYDHSNERSWWVRSNGGNSKSVTIEMKAFEEYNQLVLCVCNKCNHLNE